MTRSHYRIMPNGYPHFITATINNRLPVFTRPQAVDIVLACWRFLQQESGLEIFGYVIMENHLHLIARSRDLGEDIQRFKSFTAKKIVAYLQWHEEDRLLRLMVSSKRRQNGGSDYQVWGESGHPQAIESEEMLRQKLDHMHQNPVKRGYVDAAEDWRYSSARSYAGLEGLIGVHTEWQGKGSWAGGLPGRGKLGFGKGSQN